MPLDSDASGPDSQLSVVFYTHKHEPHEGVDFVRIAVPGNDFTVIDTIANASHKARFPLHWLHYQSQVSPGTIVGTALKDWNAAAPGDLTEHMMAELQILHFASVEQVAKASDGQLQRVGMGGPGLRERARAFLARQNMSETALELEKTRNELAELRAMIADMAPAGRQRAVKEA